MSELKEKIKPLSNIRSEFPILNRKVNGNDLVYFDNAATTQKPERVIKKIEHYYTDINSNVHRGVHTLSQIATDEFEKSRDIVKSFLNANKREEIIFTKGTTDSINLVAASVGKHMISEGDEILITEMEHHSNIVPWQMIAEEKGAKLRYIPLTDNSELDLSSIDELINDNTKFVSLVHVSNSLGTINDVKSIISKAHKYGALVMIDGAQSIQHFNVDVQALDCDFYCFSGHKLFGPLGIGVLYGKEDILNELPPYQGGGEMIEEVRMKKTTYNIPPFKFEAGTPNIVGAIGLAEAIEFFRSYDLSEIVKKEEELLKYAEDKIDSIEGSIRYSKAKNRVSVLSFNIEDVFHFDLGTFLDKMGIACRTGHHCTQPIMQKFGIQGTLRASFAFYNTKEEIDYFAESLDKSLNILR